VKDLGELLELPASKCNPGLAVLIARYGLRLRPSRINIMASVPNGNGKPLANEPKAVLSHKKAHHKAYGTTPMGFSREGLELKKTDAGEQDTVRLIRSTASDVAACPAYRR